MPQASKVFVFGFFGLFPLVGIIAVCAGFWTWYRSEECKSWPTTQGMVESSSVTYHSGKHGGTYSADVSYDYAVGGNHYTSTHLAFGMMSASRIFAQEVVSRYPVKKMVTVYYSPGDPELAVLETGVHGGMWICFGVGTVFVLVGGMFLEIILKARAANADYAPLPPPGTSLGTKQPPILMGVIFMVVGAFPLLMPGSTTQMTWLAYAAGGVFVFAGLYMLASRLPNKLPSKILGMICMGLFLAVFHWVAFGQKLMPFEVGVVIMDLVIVLVTVNWLKKTFFK